jgi:hypothetical protein
VPLFAVAGPVNGNGRRAVGLRRHGGDAAADARDAADGASGRAGRAVKLRIGRAEQRRNAKPLECRPGADRCWRILLFWLVGFLLRAAATEQ